MKRIFGSVFTFIFLFAVFWLWPVNDDAHRVMSESGVTMYENVPYAQLTDYQLLDFYLPPGEPREITAILYLHGGSWNSGSKNDYSRECYELSANNDIAAACMNYRLTPDGADYNDMMIDIDYALMKMSDLAAADGYTLKDVVLQGYSAGAHLALLYTYKHTPAVPVALCVSIAGPSDFTNAQMYSSENKEYIFASISGLVQRDISPATLEENMDVLREASPVFFVSEGAPPALLAYGRLDSTVDFAHGQAMNDALLGKGADVRMFIFENSDHDMDNDEETRALFYQEMHKMITQYCQVGE